MRYTHMAVAILLLYGKWFQLGLTAHLHHWHSINLKSGSAHGLYEHYRAPKRNNLYDLTQSVLSVSEPPFGVSTDAPQSVESLASDFIVLARGILKPGWWNLCLCRKHIYKFSKAAAAIRGQASFRAL